MLRFGKYGSQPSPIEVASEYPTARMRSPKVLLQGIKHVLSPMESISVLHKPQFVEISINWYYGDKNVFQNLYLSLSSHHAVMEYRTDYSVTGLCKLHSHPLRVGRLPDHEMRILDPLNVPRLIKQSK